MSDAATRSRATWAVPLAIYLAAVVVYVLLGTQHEIPLIFPDEPTYGHLARSVASGDGLTWYGRDESWPMVLYIYLLAPSWALASGESAYDLAKVTGALAACTVVIPVWVLARAMLQPALAAIPAVLAVSGTWMLTSAGLLTENAALPLSTAALAATVLALRDWPSRWRWAALVFAGFATFARAQMGVLFAVMFAALLLDALLAGDRKARLEERRVELLVLAAIVLAGVAVVLSGSESTLGNYAQVKDLGPSAGAVPAALGEQWIALAVMSAVLPLAALVTVGAQLRLWRDRDTGALLCVTVPSVLLFILQSSYFIAGVPGLDWGIDRYVVYAVPLLLVVLVVALDRSMLPWRWFGAASVVVSLSLLGAPEFREAVEQRASYATAQLVDGFADVSPGVALAIAGVLLSVAAAAIVARTSRSHAVWAVGGLLLIAFVVQAQRSWRWQLDFTQQVRAQYPASLTWVDDNAGAPVTRMFTYQNSQLFQAGELFNERIEQSLVPAEQGSGRRPRGPTCTWGVAADGTMEVTPGCGPVRPRIWNDDPYVTMSFHGGRTLARDRALGQIIAVPENPRVQSIIRMPCQRVGLAVDKANSPVGVPPDVPCPPDMTAYLWADDPGTLELTFEGGTRPQSVSLGERRWAIPPGRRTIVRVPVSGGASSVTLTTDWDRQAGARLTAAVYDGGGKRASLL